jgi:hypothetical protein
MTVVFDAAKTIIQIADPRIESDFISGLHFFMRAIEVSALGLYSDRYRTQIKIGRLKSKQASAREGVSRASSVRATTSDIFRTLSTSPERARSSG